MNMPGVTGVLCTDKLGLCLGARGNAPAHSSGLIATLANHAKALEANAEAPPIVCLESDSGNILIRAKDGITTAIYKVPSGP
ncbi:PREDICTED: ragulator complex protein LAMTOR5-like isoform X2 [Priapulus caudatus]|nr:PREDICTED: ragulator complex protein LAMTOR5-like isoform X2 [Priapulus caudatus]